MCYNWFNWLYRKIKSYPKMRIQSLSSHPHADGKSDEVFLVHKTFLEQQNSAAVFSKTADKSKNNNNEMAPFSSSSVIQVSGSPKNVLQRSMKSLVLCLLTCLCLIGIHVDNTSSSSVIFLDGEKVRILHFVSIIRGEETLFYFTFRSITLKWLPWKRPENRLYTAQITSLNAAERDGLILIHCHSPKSIGMSVQPRVAWMGFDADAHAWSAASANSTNQHPIHFHK